MASLEQAVAGVRQPSSFRSAEQGSAKWLYRDPATGEVQLWSSYGAAVTQNVQTAVGAAVDTTRPVWGPQTRDRILAAMRARNANPAELNAPAQTITDAMVAWALAIAYHGGQRNAVALLDGTVIPAFNVQIPRPPAPWRPALTAQVVYAAEGQRADAGCFVTVPTAVRVRRSQTTDPLASSVQIGAGTRVEVLGRGTVQEGADFLYLVQTGGGFRGWLAIPAAAVTGCPAASTVVGVEGGGAEPGGTPPALPPPPPPPGAPPSSAACVATLLEASHLRPTPTADRVGPMIPAGERIEVLARRQDITRGAGEAFYRVRVASTGAGGFMFLPLSRVGCNVPLEGSAPSSSSGRAVGWILGGLAVVGVVGAGVAVASRRGRRVAG